ncbi:MAG: hypothetical protein KDD69_06900 [Bdellovibrionales bacterium]|nr:hypothetical protein [Bdellovibrionales bacterium]
MNVALLQMDIAWDDAAQNVTMARALGEEAVRRKAELLLFPEMFTCGFSFPTGDRARHFFAAGTKLLTTLSKECAVATAGSLPEIPADDALEKRARNTLVVCGPSGELGRYSKVHLFGHGGEGSNALPGDSTLTVTIGGVRVSLFICYDLRFPQPFALLAEQTDLFVVVANWPEVRQSHWETLLRARAIENQAYVAGVNRVGNGGGISYSGCSSLYSPSGELIVHGGATAGVSIGTVDPAEVRRYREAFPCLADRRWELYQTIRR